MDLVAIFQKGSLIGNSSGIFQSSRHFLDVLQRPPADLDKFKNYKLFMN